MGIPQADEVQVVDFLEDYAHVDVQKCNSISDIAWPQTQLSKFVEVSLCFANNKNSTNRR